MRTVDLTSASETADLVADTVRDAAIVAIDNLAELGLALYGAGIVNNERRLEFATVADQGRDAVRESASGLVAEIVNTTVESWAGHDNCDGFARECGESLQTVASTLAKLTDEVERGWLYGDGLVRTLDGLYQAVQELADGVTTRREAEYEDVPIYLANVPVEMAGKVAV